MRLGIVGGGRAAWFFASGWRNGGGQISGFALRDGSSSPVPALVSAPVVPLEGLSGLSDVLLIAVRDAALPEMADELRMKLPDETVLFHCSGSIPAAVFSSFERRFALHPLRALPEPGVEVMPPTLFAYEGAEATESLAREIVAVIGGLLVPIESDRKPVYHAAAVMASNYVALLADEALELFARAGIDRNLARDAVAGVGISALETWRKGSGRVAFSGPVVRGDIDVVQRHLNALSEAGTRSLYRQLGYRLAMRLSAIQPENSEYKEIAELLADPAFLDP